MTNYRRRTELMANANITTTLRISPDLYERLAKHSPAISLNATIISLIEQALKEEAK